MVLSRVSVTLALLDNYYLAYMLSDLGELAYQRRKLNRNPSTKLAVFLKINQILTSVANPLSTSIC